VGSDWHRVVIRALYDGLWLAGPGRGRPWHIGDQLEHLIARPRMALWRPGPDIAVHLTAGSQAYVSFDTRTEGMPPFIVEVVSRTTWKNDIGEGDTPETYGKVFGYGFAGVQEYLVFDPHEEWLGTPLRAWRQTAEGFVPWPAAVDGRWYSQALGVSLAVELPLLRVYDGEGRLKPVFDEEHRRAEQAEQRAERERLRAEQAEQRAAALEAELRRLRGEG
jgi:Uma2 family endonuclease